MKCFFTFIVLLALNAGCKPRVLSGTELESKLIETMKDHLEKTLEPGVKVTIKDVIYYPEPGISSYLCQFHVNMHYRNSDTTGTVAATISNDFSKVERTK